MIGTRLALAAAALLLAAPAGAQSIATVSTAKGEVSLLEAATQSPRALAAAADGRVANGAIAQGDEIRTGAGASASLLFPDGSVVRVAESTRVAVTERPIPGAGNGTGRKSVKRQLLLKEGSLACDIKPKTAIYTSIRTALGTVGVRGTGLTVSVVGGRLQVAVESGQVFLMDTPGRAVFDLGGGQTVQLEINEQDQLVAQVLADGGSPVMLTVGNARARMSNGAILRVGGVAGERLTVTGIAGAIRITYPATGASESLPAGKTVPVLGPDAPGPAPGADATGGTSSVGTDPYPADPTVPVVRDTVEASKFR
jgi:hypothetical protein